MKHLITLIFGLLIMTSCSQSNSNNYTTFQGKLENNKDSIITIFDREGAIKNITIDKEGAFKDTLILKNKEGQIYRLSTNPSKSAPIFLRNGYDITLKGDANNFMNSFTYSGKGASNSNFIIAQIQQNQKIGDLQAILDLEPQNFESKMNKLKKDYDKIINSYNDLDSAFYEAMKNQNTQLINYFKGAYQKNRIMGKGRPSPNFKDYLSIDGSKKSLSDFKGKYLYIDVWATWCGPCIVQFPYLKDLKKEYKNKNIEFIGISTDESRKNGGSWEAAENKWKNFVKEKGLNGVQLWSGKDYSFQQAYQINSIPRFILIDPQGKIVESEAPRPSDPALKQLLNSLLE